MVTHTKTKTHYCDNCHQKALTCKTRLDKARQDHFLNNSKELFMLDKKYCHIPFLRFAWSVVTPSRKPCMLKNKIQTHQLMAILNLQVWGTCSKLTKWLVTVLFPLFVNTGQVFLLSGLRDVIFTKKNFESLILKLSTNISILSAPNGQTHSNNSSATADELFECVWPFCGVGD